jgi:1,4-alpha-glucan branching enzyme
MLSLALILELHHPLPGPGADAGGDWTAASLECYWPLLLALWNFTERRSEASVTLAVSPSWTALAADLAARDRVLAELDRRAAQSAALQPLRRFVAERWAGDATGLLRRLAGSGAVDVIPMTASHTWLPSVAHDPVVARAQISLAAQDHAGRFGVRPAGIWLPFLSYLPGLESIMGESGLRYFGAAATAFLRGTMLAPDGLLAPLVTPAGVAVFAVDPEPTRQVGASERGYGNDPRYHDTAAAVRAASDHAHHFVERWRQHAPRQAGPRAPGAAPVSAIAIRAHELELGWPGGGGGLWLEAVLNVLATIEGASTVSLARYLDQHPSGPVGRPGPTAGGLLAARPHGSDLFDRCRAAALLLTAATQERGRLNALSRRTVAQMVRHLLRAQQIDWSLPPGHGVGPETGLARSQMHLACFWELAGLLLAGRPDARRLRQLQRGPAYLPEIDIELLAGR